jgi:hypothetical protein
MGRLYKTVEHAYQAAKTDIGGQKEKVRLSATPGQAKRIGLTVLLRDGWDDEKIEVMKTLLKIKFSIPELRQKLMDTKDIDLVEGNTWGDFFWGVDSKSGQGENVLGMLLMLVRAELQKEYG